MYEYIRNTPAVSDVVISGGDSYYLQPQQLHDVCKTLLDIPNVRRIRIATKGLAVCPSRIMDPNDQWTDELIWVSNYGRKMGKTVAVHTHFNHPNEITWITKVATQKLFAAAVTVRNQAVLIKGVNDNLETMSALIRDLSDINVLPVSTRSTLQL
jgi:lysine 2,3-aminomutase